ncbi:hypothetical protein GCM10025858_00280 [Alicyclobacillus sacchari]|nr:hypothetical protein GCM10025858_00280 [Alicyclobacillus sacchari]
MKSISIVCIVGPTAIGKSELAVVVAKRYGGEVVSADSMQVYRGMDIGTAKLTKEEMEGVEHHLIDVVDPADTYTAARWKHAADAVIVDIAGRGHLPVVCGGTGLYIRALTDDLDFIKAPETAESRTHWQRYLAEHGAFALYEALRERDPERAQQLHPNDVKRVIRALEVADAAAAPMSARYDWSVRSGRYHTLIIGLTMEREALYRRVDQRVLQMWKAAFRARCGACWRQASYRMPHRCRPLVTKKWLPCWLGRLGKRRRLRRFSAIPGALSSGSCLGFGAIRAWFGSKRRHLATLRPGKKRVCGTRSTSF